MIGSAVLLLLGLVGAEPAPASPRVSTIAVAVRNQTAASSLVSVWTHDRRAAVAALPAARKVAFSLLTAVDQGVVIEVDPPLAGHRFYALQDVLRAGDTGTLELALTATGIDFSTTITSKAPAPSESGSTTPQSTTLARTQMGQAIFDLDNATLGASRIVCLAVDGFEAALPRAGVPPRMRLIGLHRRPRGSDDDWFSTLSPAPGWDWKSNERGFVLSSFNGFEGTEIKASGFASTMPATVTILSDVEKPIAAGSVTLRVVPCS